MNYSLSNWVDGNLEIQRDLEAVVGDLQKGKFSLMYHGRDCIYEEAHACISSNKDSPDVINGQMNSYRSDGFPEHEGMVATGLIIRDHNTKKTVSFAQKWWEQVRLCSKRDQLSFNYTLWKYPMDVNVMDFNNIIKNYFNWGSHHT